MVVKATERNSASSKLHPRDSLSGMSARFLTIFPLRSLRKRASQISFRKSARNQNCNVDDQDVYKKTPQWEACDSGDEEKALPQHK
jgi:hypothetical protein